MKSYRPQQQVWISTKIRDRMQILLIGINKIGKTQEARRFPTCKLPATQLANASRSWRERDGEDYWDQM